MQTRLGVAVETMPWAELHCDWTLAHVAYQHISLDPHACCYIVAGQDLPLSSTCEQNFGTGAVKHVDVQVHEGPHSWTSEHPGPNRQPPSLPV